MESILSGRPSPASSRPRFSRSLRCMIEVECRHLSRWKSKLATVALLSSVAIAGAQETANAEGTRPAQGPSMTMRRSPRSASHLIDYLGEAPDFAGDKLFKTLLATMHARDVCAQGRESAALSLYDRAVLDLVFPVARYGERTMARLLGFFARWRAARTAARNRRIQDIVRKGLSAIE